MLWFSYIQRLGYSSVERNRHRSNCLFWNHWQSILHFGLAKIIIEIWIQQTSTCIRCLAWYIHINVFVIAVIRGWFLGTISQGKKIYIYKSFLLLAVMDLIFLIMLIISDGLCYGIFIYGRPRWLDIIYPFGIHPMFFMFRFCTTYMLVVISIERYIALSNLMVYKSRCYSYIILVVLYSSELVINANNLWKSFKNRLLKHSLF